MVCFIISWSLKFVFLFYSFWIFWNLYFVRDLFLSFTQRALQWSLIFILSHQQIFGVFFSDAGTQDQDCEQKLIQLKETVSRNAANMPKVIKRVRECVERIHRLDSLGGRTIHPAFTRRRLNWPPSLSIFLFRLSIHCIFLRVILCAAELIC